VTTWDEMFAYRHELEQKPGELKAQRKILTMHGRYGHGPEGEQCKDCVHCVAIRLANTYHKCELFGITGGPGTDWRLRFKACGRFEKAS
jgi:hypothetical protein